MKKKKIIKRLLNTKETAQYLGLSESLLRQGRMHEQKKNLCLTPSYIKMGKTVRYDLNDLEAFIQKNRVQKNILINLIKNEDFLKTRCQNLESKIKALEKLLKLDQGFK